MQYWNLLKSIASIKNLYCFFLGSLERLSTKVISEWSFCSTYSCFTFDKFGALCIGGGLPETALMYLAKNPTSDYTGGKFVS